MRPTTWNGYLTTFDKLISGAKEAGRGDTRSLLLRGGPGTGKTALLQEFGRRATALGAIYLTASGFQNECEVPFATVEQLAQTPGIPDTVRSALSRLMNRSAPPDSPHAVDVRHLRELGAALARVTRRTPLVIAVDDLPYVDLASQTCLMYLARRSQANGIIMIAACGPTRLNENERDFTQNFLGLPGNILVEVSTLPECEVRLLLRRKFGPETADRLGPSTYDITGGNPALVSAILRDLAASDAARTDPPTAPGDAFRTAYGIGLVRHPAFLRCVQALAVLGGDGTPALVGRLLNRDPEKVAQDIAELNRAGLLDDGRFRHPVADAEVLYVSEDADRRRLHRRAAMLLREDGAPAAAIAKHLVAADEKPDVEQVPVLLRAARQLLDEKRADEAIGCLRLADRADLDERGRLDIAVALVDALWYINPAAAEPEVERLLTAMSAGLLDERALHVLVAWLLWFGRGEEAGEAIAHLTEILSPHDPQSRDRISVTQSLIGYLSPTLLDALPDSVVSRRSTDLFPADAEGRPEPSVPNDGQQFWDGDIISLFKLCHRADLLPADEFYRELLAHIAANDRYPARQAIFMSLHAHILIMRGDLRSSAACAAAALDLLPHHGWGIAIGGPLACLVTAHTIMGNLDEAACYLEHPVPEAMMQSVFGLHYLMARGHHYLATGRASAALRDFTAGAALADLLRDEAVGFAGWRTSAAEVHLVLGDSRTARKLIEAEIAQLGDRPGLTRGRALRVLAAAGDPEVRGTRLEEAARVLHGCGAQMLLAGALADLSRVRLEAGETEKARALWHEAQRLIGECGASRQYIMDPGALLSPTAYPTAVSDRENAADPPGGDVTTVGAAAEVSALSEAEWRVASLASMGKSNRQIASHLYITVSTVEQHLTRVYRKLSIRRRADLRRLLGPSTWDANAGGSIL
ncbi:AAA family ATPase [Streptomyces xiangluensis]|uniref:AAA family ATPase n=1 Tax=Streptomyces xiangluensis TaxID=2665720 RepID=A0ABV8Z5S5_9ACTN